MVPFFGPPCISCLCTDCCVTSLLLLHVVAVLHLFIIITNITTPTWFFSSVCIIMSTGLCCVTTWRRWPSVRPRTVTTVRWSAFSHCCRNHLMICQQLQLVVPSPGPLHTVNFLVFNNLFAIFFNVYYGWWLFFDINVDHLKLVVCTYYLYYLYMKNTAAYELVK